MIGDRYAARKLAKDSLVGGGDSPGLEAFKQACEAFVAGRRKLTPADRQELRDMADALLPRSRSVGKRGEVSDVSTSTDTPT